MKKTDLQVHLEYFKKLYSEFLEPENDYEKGRNKKIRDRGLREAEFIINRFERYVFNNELYNLLTCEDCGEYQKSIIWNEFVSMSYFRRDLNEVIEKVETLLK